MAGTSNDVSYKNNTHKPGISIYYFPKDVAVSPRSSTSRRFYSSMLSAICLVLALKTSVTNTYHLLNQRKITNEFSWKECWLRGLFPHRTRLFNIPFGWHFASEDWWAPYVVYFTRLRCTHTSCLSTWLHLRFSYRRKILPIVVSIVL